MCLKKCKRMSGESPLYCTCMDASVCTLMCVLYKLSVCVCVCVCVRETREQVDGDLSNAGDALHQSSVCITRHPVALCVCVCVSVCASVCVCVCVCVQRVARGPEVLRVNGWSLVPPADSSLITRETHMHTHTGGEGEGERGTSVTRVCVCVCVCVCVSDSLHTFSCHFLFLLSF